MERAACGSTTPRSCPHLRWHLHCAPPRARLAGFRPKRSGSRKTGGFGPNGRHQPIHICAGGLSPFVILGQSRRDPLPFVILGRSRSASELRKPEDPCQSKADGRGDAELALALHSYRAAALSRAWILGSPPRSAQLRPRMTKRRRRRQPPTPRPLHSSGTVHPQAWTLHIGAGLPIFVILAKPERVSLSIFVILGRSRSAANCGDPRIHARA
jgi:hypothetical protein